MTRGRKQRPAGLPWYMRTTLAEVSDFFSAPNSRVRDWKAKGAPISAEVPFDMREVVSWWAESVAIAKSTDGRKNQNLLAATQELKVKEMQQKIRREELRYAKDLHQLIPVKFIDEVMDRFEVVMQRAGENLRRFHGDEAQKELLDAISTVQADLKGMFQEHEVQRLEAGEVKAEPKTKPKRKAAKKKATKASRKTPRKKKSK